MLFAHWMLLVATLALGGAPAMGKGSATQLNHQGRKYAYGQTTPQSRARTRAFIPGYILIGRKKFAREHGACLAQNVGISEKRFRHIRIAAQANAIENSWGPKRLNMVGDYATCTCNVLALEIQPQTHLPHLPANSGSTCA